MQQRHNGAEAPHATHDEVAPGTGSRLISGSGVTRPIRLRWLRQRVALSRVGGALSFLPSPTFQQRAGHDRTGWR